jgi:hypothetical protein
MALEGKNEEAKPPFEWVVSRICEEFHCLPTAALTELLDDPAGMAIEILELRAYARAKESLDNAKSKNDVPDSPMIDMVMEIQADLAKRKRGESE